ncbi:MAG TPA: anthranilate phosphoribosyltransferase [Nitrososphaeraceae archaeon]|nr:anthranilate phosphoribosyltransferase [Nitrososphaeraceae archaeon]
MSTEYLQQQTRKILLTEDIDEFEFRKAIDHLLLEDIPDCTIAAFITALTSRGVKYGELRIIREVILAHSYLITPKVSGSLIDNCGTGGDMVNSFNISTAASIIASASGINVAKHGNRSASGLCGSADFFEHVGFNLDTEEQALIDALEGNGFSFLFAPKFHPNLKRLSVIRKQLGFKTVFNIVGPLCNPCTNITGQVIGISDPKIFDLISNAMIKSPLKKIIIVHSSDGMDELSNTSSNIMLSIESGKIERQEVDPMLLDMKIVKREQIQISSIGDSVKSTLQTIYGKSTEAKQDIVSLNAAIALIAGGKVTEINDGIKMARELIKSELPKTKLRELISCCGNVRKLDILEEKFSL